MVAHQHGEPDMAYEIETTKAAGFQLDGADGKPLRRVDGWAADIVWRTPETRELVWRSCVYKTEKAARFRATLRRSELQAYHARNGERREVARKREREAAKLTARCDQLVRELSELPADKLADVLARVANKAPGGEVVRLHRIGG